MAKKAISMVMSLVILTTYTNISFANNALNQAQSATTNASKAFDGSIPQAKSDLPSVKASINTTNPSMAKDGTNTSSQEPEKPSFGQKLWQDIKNNKTSYITVGAAAGLLGFILGGPIGALIGIGAMFAFTVTQRADYIDAYVKPE